MVKDTETPRTNDWCHCREVGDVTEQPHRQRKKSGRCRQLIARKEKQGRLWLLLTLPSRRRLQATSDVHWREVVVAGRAEDGRCRSWGSPEQHLGHIRINSIRPHHQSCTRQTGCDGGSYCDRPSESCGDRPLHIAAVAVAAWISRRRAGLVVPLEAGMAVLLKLTYLS